MTIMPRRSPAILLAVSVASTLSLRVEHAAHHAEGAKPASPSAAGFDWGLELPKDAVPRRLSRTFSFRGPEPTLLGELPGPGCIRRIWVTGQNIGREVVLRITFDGAETPHVEAPLSDFFGAMHNLADRGEPYRINTPFLAVKPKNGFTCYLPMPFAESARIEVIGGERSSRLYYFIDWHEYPGQELAEPLRFCARWRREAPVRDYADEFLMLDADGPGRLVGFVYSVDMLQSRHEMRWSHGGADNIYINGDGEHPAFLRGIGGEDTFGTSYSGGDYVAQTSIFSDMPFYIQKDDEGDRQKLVGYRFFVQDAIPFRRSLHVRFGARAHDVAATVYWYSARPVRPFFEMPPIEKRLPGSTLRKGEYDLPLPETGRWWIAGPFPVPFEHLLPTGDDFDADEPFHGRAWREFQALRGFVEFNHVYRPEPTNANSPTLDAVAVARCTLDSPRKTTARLTLAWDDRLVIRVNDGEPIDLGVQEFPRRREIEVPLEAGPNRIALWLSNTSAEQLRRADLERPFGVTHGGWNFSFRAVTAEGDVLVPQAD
jgi:hypothetical protein